jgi:uncharacterized protein with PIN domain
MVRPTPGRSQTGPESRRHDCTFDIHAQQRFANAERPMNDPEQRSAEFRFYAELNDRLAETYRGRSFVVSFRGNPTVGTVVEDIGVPLRDIDMFLVDGTSVDENHRLTGGERVAAFPVFERFDVSAVTRLEARPLRHTRFVADVHLGGLARYLRMIGFDTVYHPDLSDREILAISRTERRIILTRDRRMLERRDVTHAYLVERALPKPQLREVVHQFHLVAQMAPFTRCLRCNSTVRRLDADKIADRVPARVLASNHKFTECPTCGRVFWKGSHYERMSRFVEDLRDSTRT